MIKSFWKTGTDCSRSRARLHRHRRAVTNHLRDPRADLRRVITHADDRIRAEFSRVREHLIERILARPLTQVSVKRDIAAEQTLNARTTMPRTTPCDFVVRNPGRSKVVVVNGWV
jgi:hypothetical protein